MHSLWYTSLNRQVNFVRANFFQLKAFSKITSYKDQVANHPGWTTKHLSSDHFLFINSINQLKSLQKKKSPHHSDPGILTVLEAVRQAESVDASKTSHMIFFYSPALNCIIMFDFCMFVFVKHFGPKAYLLYTWSQLGLQTCIYKHLFMTSFMTVSPIITVTKTCAHSCLISQLHDQLSIEALWSPAAL